MAFYDEEYIEQKRKLKDGLVEFYKTRHSQIFLSPLFAKEETPLASLYIRPEFNSLVSIQLKNDVKIPVKSLSELFKTESQYNHEIYIIADAGLGKTTFSNYLAITWCQAHCPDGNMSELFSAEDIDCMKEFDFVFLVGLRDSHDLCSVDELIFEKVFSNAMLPGKPPNNFMLKVLKNEKCLVILDGLDEWTHPEKKCYRTPKTIPHRNDRAKCTILTTTRPWKLGVSNLNSVEQGKKVELTKLSRKSAVSLTERILQRLKSYPNNDALENDVRRFIEELDSRDNSGITSVPLVLIYAIYLWCDGVQVGNSLCDLCINIVELLLSRTILTRGELQHLRGIPDRDIPKYFAEYDNCKKYYTLLVTLGKLAFYTLIDDNKENTLVFNASVAKKYLTPDEMTFILHTGILSENTTYTLTKKFSKVSFSLKTLQEIFAAIFISSLQDAKNIVAEKCRNVHGILDISVIWEFVSKLNADLMLEILKYLPSVINEDDETHDYRTSTGAIYLPNSPLYNIQKMFLSCLKEMPENENIELCVQDFFIDCETEHNEQLQRLLKQNKFNIKSLYIDTGETSHSAWEVIQLFSLSDLRHVQKLVYLGVDRKEEVEINLLLFPSLQNLTLWWGKCTNEKKNLSENLARLQNLQYLHINNFELSHDILQTIFNFISVQESMRELTLLRLDCKEHGRRDCKGLILDLSRHSNISRLQLHGLPTIHLNTTTPSLVDVTLEEISLDQRSLLLSHDMVNIKRVELLGIQMRAGILPNLISVLENLPQSVEVKMDAINPGTEYERVREMIRRSQTFHVIHDGKDSLRLREFLCKTIKPIQE